MSSIVVILFVGIVFGYFLIRTEIRTLQDQVVQRDNQIQTLQAQVNDLNEDMTQKDNQIQSLQRQINNLNQSYINLQREYEDLLFHYNLLNKPVSNFTTVNDLNITLALHRTTYYYKDPVSGNVTITYLNGTAFRGAFILYILHLTKEAMSTTAGIAIDGFTEFYLSPPVFQFGPGNYAIGISSLSTADGYIIESRWRVFPSVQVEVK